MATTLYLLDTVPDTHLGTDNLNKLSAAVGWTSKALGTARGSGVVASDNVATVTGITPGIVVTKTSPVEWISPPVAADVTISGTVTFNAWASESSMTANVTVAMSVEVIRANATATRNSNTLETVASNLAGGELALTTRAVVNWTSASLGVTVNRGDRLRVIVWGDDGGGTMATGFTFNASWNGTSAAADGDSYVTFTENITFESAPGVFSIARTGSGITGNATGNQARAAKFTAGGSTVTDVVGWVAKVAAPTDDLVVELQTDSAGVPSGSVVANIATISGASLTTTATQTTWSGLSIAVTSGSSYWVVFRRSGSLDITNHYAVGTGAGSLGAGLTGTGWTLSTSIAIQVTSTVSTVYLTDTASAVSTASVDKEMWTSPGAGTNDLNVNSVAGWSAPIHMTDNTGGTVVDWFTRPLTAFTLGGMAVASMWPLEANAANNLSLRCEIARVDNDGTNPTVWSSWCIAPQTTDNGEVNVTTSTERFAYLSGDDLAISDGQRLRFRAYADDISSAAMAAGGILALQYAGSAAPRNSYITFPQTLTESVGGPAAHINIPVGFAMGRDY